ncbi:Bacillopeptidase F [Orchesella cincta]|uniref:Bacillopeptidase F n=1 Tax=Orchesella cincta TaxID=48709 RepID=A0A1D2MMK8_ORCCI|nr:Bacillopeptidase F [Orchesella cincta]
MKFAIAIVAAVALCHVSAVPTGLLQKLRTEGKADAMIILGAEVAPVIAQINSQRFTNSVEKTTVLVAALKEHTRITQKAVLSFLETRELPVKSFWITNRIFVPEMTLEEHEALQSQFKSVVADIREPVVAHIDYTVDSQDSNPQELEWGVENIRAPEVWADGVEGEGVVVSHIDTGVRGSHETFAGALRETHNWLDPYTNTATPSDANGHGTHTMGTIVGRGGTGVAPKATYISCRGCDTASCTEPALLACGQFTTCPTLPDGTEEIVLKKPALSIGQVATENTSVQIC